MADQVQDSSSEDDQQVQDSSSEDDQQDTSSEDDQQDTSSEDDQQVQDSSSEDDQQDTSSEDDQQDSSSEDDQQDTSSEESEDHQQLVLLNRDREYDYWREKRDSRIWHHLIFCEELENDDLQNGAFCWLCEKPVLRGTPAYKCLECYFLQHKSCVNRPHGQAIIDHKYRQWKRHHLIFIKEDLQDKGGEEKKAIHQKRRIKKKEKKVVCSGCKEPPTIGRDPAYKCSMPDCTFLLHKSCGDQLPTLIKHPLHDPDPYRDTDPGPESYPDPVHILLLKEQSKSYFHEVCYVCSKDCSGSLFYSCNVEDCKFYLHATCALLSIVNPDDCHHHKLIPSWKTVQFTCQSCGEETKDIAYLCSECRVLIHGKCAQFQHTIKTTTHDHSLTRTYSLSHQLDIFCKLCYKKLNTVHAAYYCCRECGYYVAHLDCANKVRDPRPPNEWVPVNSDDYLTHLVHLVEGINLAYDERVSLPEIQHFSHPEHNLILSNEEPIDDMRCEACMQFIISRAPFYGCTRCKFFLHDRCARLPRTIQRGIFHEHSLTLLPRAPYDKNGFFKCNACERHRHGFVYNCSNCEYHLDVQCCLIPETLKHEGHQHDLFLARRSSETCNACGKDCQDHDVRLVCTNCNFTLCIRCATLPLVAKYQYETDLLKLSYTCEDDSEEYYCVICEEERNHPDHWFYYGVKSKFTAHTQCVLGDYPCIKFESTYRSQLHMHPFTFIQKTNPSPPCDFCYKPFYGVALKCFACKFNIHVPILGPHHERAYVESDECLWQWALRNNQI